MKEKLTLRNVILWSASLIGLVVFCVSFAIKGVFEVGGDRMVFNNIIWGSTSGTMRGETQPMSYILGFERLHANVFGLLGVIFALVAAIALVLSVFVIKNEKISKIVVFSAAGLMLLGGIFQFLIVPGIENSIASTYIAMGANPAEAQAEAKEIAMWAKLSGGSIVCALFTIFGALGAALSQFIPDKKLAK